MNANVPSLLDDLEYLYSVASLAPDQWQKQTKVAYNRLKAALDTDVKIVYAFKLRRGDGKYLNRSNWDQKGKLYSKKGNLSAAFSYHIGNAIEKANVAPKYSDYGSSNAYMEAYRAWHKKREDKEFRATFIPADWVVICIPTNTNAPIIEISAREWYLHGIQDSQ